MFDVYITKASKFLPNKVICNDEMESYLGLINNTVSKVKNLILRNNGITSRYYALDKNGKATHTNAELTFKAIEGLFDDKFTKQDIEVLSCGTSSPDYMMPSHASMVHGFLKNKSVELNSSAGVCNAGMNALKYGFLSVRSGNSKTAVCAGSERFSSMLIADRFEYEVVNLKTLEEQPILAFKKDFLRFMLSDGAAAFLLENEPNGETPLKVEWMEAYSFAHELETCMYAGGDKLENGDIKPWSDYKSDEWLEQSVFSIKQDVKLLDVNIIVKGADCVKMALEKNNVKPEDVTYFMPHVSSHYFVDRLVNQLTEIGIDMPKEKWFMNLKDVGNVGAASIFLMLEELVNSGRLKKGDTMLLSVPESGRFSYALAYLTVC
ncbi:beta-ketoacyl-ACP synthase III [Flavobacterium sp. ZS1P14]|uniref:beta-ketoacyl-ACP synthase III n=1 Tax=Flavobacterium sp. ZS1P14 TaxID=3401729 RepID=UPI003AAE5F54